MKGLPFLSVRESVAGLKVMLPANTSACALAVRCRVMVIFDGVGLQ